MMSTFKRFTLERRFLSHGHGAEDDQSEIICLFILLKKKSCVDGKLVSAFT